jgi:hypothetical protein
VRFYTRFPAHIVHAEAAFRHILNDNSSKTTMIASLVRDDIESPPRHEQCLQTASHFTGRSSLDRLSSFVCQLPRDTDL